MKRSHTFMLFALSAFTSFAAEPSRSEHTTLEQREAFRRKITEVLIPQSFVGDSICQRHLAGAFWAMSAFNTSTPEGQKLVQQCIARYSTLSAKNRYALLSLLHSQCYANKHQIFASLLPLESEAKLKALILAHSSDLPTLHKELPPDWAFLAHTNDSLELSTQQVDELIQYICRTRPNERHLMLFCQADRNRPALIKVIDPTRGGLQPESYTYLARSATNLLPYFTNGNTPAGVFHIDGESFSDNIFIGPTATIITQLPFESNPSAWGINHPKWHKELYAQLLPPSLRTSAMLWQSFHAGQVGRGEIIIHGSTIDPSFFHGTPFYPLTPSLGCMSALELYSAATGELMESHQQRLLNAFRSKGSPWGLLYVVQAKTQRSLFDKIVIK